VLICSFCFNIDIILTGVLCRDYTLRDQHHLPLFGWLIVWTEAAENSAHTRVRLASISDQQNWSDKIMTLHNGIFQISLRSGCLVIAFNVHIPFSQFALTSSVPTSQSLPRSFAQSITRLLTQNLSTQALLSPERSFYCSTSNSQISARQSMWWLMASTHFLQPKRCILETLS